MVQIPGLVFFESDVNPHLNLQILVILALWQLINRNNAKKFAKKNDLEFFYQGKWSRDLLVQLVQ